MSIILNLGRDIYIKGRIGWRGLSKSEYLDNSPYKIINATALLDGYINWDDCGYISRDRFYESDDIMLQEGDILISKDGTLGKIGYVKNLDGYCTVASGIFVLRNTIKDQLNFDYLYHVLKSHIFKDFIRRNKATGSTINHLYQRDLENFEIVLPELETQDNIAKILNSIDDKIRNNNQINNELESLAKTIYDYWFLQFDFPNEEGKPYKSSGGAMVWNDKLNREIPAKWSVANFTSMADWESNSQPPKSTFIYEERNGYVRFLQNRDYESNQYKTFIPYSKNLKTVDRFDILMDKYGDAGALHYGKSGTYNVAMGKIKPSKDIYQEYLRSFLSNGGIYHYLHNSCMASTRASLGEDNLSMLYLPLPTNDILEKYQNLIHLIREEILQLKDESEELTDLRDFLLPLLMNGQVGFKDK